MKIINLGAKNESLGRNGLIAGKTHLAVFQ